MAIFMATVTASLSLVTYLLVWRGKIEWIGLARRLFFMAFACIAFALLDLLYLIVTHDFTVAYVFSYSSTDLPTGYLVASLWGGQEGTFLLWIFFASLMGLVMMRTAKKFEFGNMFFLNLFLLSVLAIIIKKSPFELLPVFRTEGSGLNPLLQNFWMTIHPPIMFVGFAAVVFPFCFAMTALVERKYRQWAEAARRWTLFAWAALGISLVMGGYWAYETLGWGGFWAWDPVENSSFIPWIFLTTQVHALFIRRQRRGLLRFSLFVVCLSFWSVLYGTFLTRSGVLADFSVHSFIDLGINQFLISGLLMFVGLGTFLLLWRWRDIQPEPSYATVASRSYIVTLGVVILFIGGILVLLGTSAPLLTRITDNPSAVGLPYYFTTMTPIAVSLLILMAIFPAFRWQNGIDRPRLLFAAGFVAASVILVLLVSGITSQLIYLMLFGAAAAAISINGYVFYKSIRSRNPISGYLSHIGLSLALVGAAASAGFESGKTLTLPQNQVIEGLGYSLTFTTVQPTEQGFNCHVDVTYDGGQFEAILPHEFPRNAEGVMKKPHVERFLAYDIYLSPLSFDPGSAAPNILSLAKEETVTFEKYEVTFHDFQMESHGDDSGPARVAAEITIKYDNKTETIFPYLEVTDQGVTPVPVTFDYGNGSMMISGINPDDGTVELNVTGAIDSQAAVDQAVLVIEISRKPLIILFWLGTMTLFAGGIWSMLIRRRRKKSSADSSLDHARTSEVEAVSH